MYFVVQPKSFGYHDDTAGIVVEIIHRPIDNSLGKSVPARISVLVESRGFSTVGLERILPIILFLILITIIVHFFYKTKIKK